MAKLSLLLAAATAGVVASVTATAASGGDDDDGVALPRCTSRCGNISIPHPFGVEAGCYLPGFNVTCRNNNSELFLGDGTVQVLDISISDATVRVSASFAYFPGSADGEQRRGPKPTASGTWSGALGKKDGPYTLARGRNTLFAAGCNIQARLEVDPNNATSSACLVLCDGGGHGDDGGDDGFSFCPGSGVGCCQAPISTRRSSYGLNVLSLNGSAIPEAQAFVWIMDSEVSLGDVMLEPKNASSRLESVATPLPAVLDWRINHTTCHGNGSSAACRSNHSFCECSHGSSHICRCRPGYQGNPYVPNGCKDVNECDHLDTYPCYGVCTNTVTDGGYKCDCFPGFSGDAYQPTGCADINKCDRNGSCYGDCLNKIGTFECRCKDGTYGDPFTKDGCRSRESKFMLAIGYIMWFLLLVSGTPFIISKIKRYRVKRRKQRYFKQNHGLLLQQLVSQNSDIGERMIITLGELEKATSKFHTSHEIGGGGHGVVYKGLLNLQVVAIKKSKIIVQREIDDFINEVTILSQINHRNIVKLLGCCLETEVPLLVYEFISNGTLSHHLHVEGTISLSWDDRLRIALEISKAIAYLHSSASTQVLHRDIKSSNILLDDNLTAKVSDFGASKYISIDQTGVTTAVQGTIGYLDPMYYYTSRLTDKSDVFSFGVLLIELLTRKKPFGYRSDDGDGLVSNFSSLLAQGTLVDIIDPQIMEEDGEQVDEVARLAAKCTKLNGEDRPTMREVEMTLESLRGTKKHVDHNINSRNKYENGKIADRYMPFGGLTVETSRQYTMEEEILLSARYPR
ncbi:hypothetical protein BS78_05G049400 [Paspalum vaginatum]|nr:hypothetical protein BS78_05G049400 [Paspalum vaginatum]